MASPDIAIIQSFPDDFDFAAQLDFDKQRQVYMLIGLWVESVLYGAYFLLFSGFVKHSVNRQREGNPASKPVFIWLVSAMFVITTYWEAVNLYRFVTAYALPNPEGFLPIYHFRDFGTWQNFSYAISSSLLFWIADFIAIYRCYIIWGRSYAIVALPFLLLLATIGTNGVNFHFFLHGPLSSSPTSIPLPTIKILLDFVYPAHLAQNILTTALIAWKILWRHSKSRQAKLTPPVFVGYHNNAKFAFHGGSTTSNSSSNRTLGGGGVGGGGELGGGRFVSGVTMDGVARIVVESALVYTLQLAALVGLYFYKHPAMAIFQAGVVPSTGIVFVLITARVQRAVETNAQKSVATSIIFPGGWPQSLSPRSTSHDIESGHMQVYVQSHER